MLTPHWLEMSTPKPESPLDEVTQWADESLAAGAKKGLLLGKLCESGWPRKTALEVVKGALEGLAQDNRGRNGSTTSSRLPLSAGGIIIRVIVGFIVGGIVGGQSGDKFIYGVIVGILGAIVGAILGIGGIGGLGGVVPLLAASSAPSSWSSSSAAAPSTAPSSAASSARSAPENEKRAAWVPV